MRRTWIADERVVFVSPDGTRREGCIAIGRPVRHDQEARCPIRLDGLEPTGTIYGASPLQALLLALRLAGMRLHDFVASGGRVVDPETRRSLPLDAYFGPLLVSSPSRARRSRGSSRGVRRRGRGSSRSRR